MEERQVEILFNEVNSVSSSDNESYFIDNDQQTCARLIPYFPVKLVQPNLQPEKTLSSPRKRSSSSSPSRTEDDSDDKRVLKKRKNFCPFCEKLITNLSRHLVTRHNDKAEVKEYVSLSSESPRERKHRRAAITNKIRHLGNKIYNTQIVENKRNGSYLPVKRSSHQKYMVNNLTHVVCNHCLGFFKKESLYRHTSKCKQFSSGESETNEECQENKKQVILPDHSTLMVKNNSASELLKKEVFPKMQKDAETVIAQGDNIITKYGSHLRFTHRTERQIHYCSSRMRTLARLFLKMKIVLPELKEFRDCINPKHFNVLVDSVRQMSNFNSVSGSMKAPSVPPRLCSSLKRCANIIKSDTIKDESLSGQEKMKINTQIDYFLFLMDKDWATEVGTNSENSRKKMKVIKKDLLPDPDDIRTLSKYINDMCPLYIERLQQIPTVSNYEKLAKLIIVHIITLNRRRPNETVEITLESYQTTLNKRISYGHDLQNVLSEKDIDSGNQLSIFYISANKNLKKVPTLLTKVFLRAVDVLIEARDKIGIESKYLFGRPGSTELFDGSAVLKEIVNKANLKSPSTFTANSLRHHAATSSQLHSRNDTFTKRLSQFMGHDLKTHEEYYEMPLPLVQKFLVGPRLLEMTLPIPSKSTTSATVTSNALMNEDLPDENPSIVPIRLNLNSETVTAKNQTSEPSTSKISTAGTFEVNQGEDLIPSTSTSCNSQSSLSSPSSSQTRNGLNETQSQCLSTGSQSNTAHVQIEENNFTPSESGDSFNPLTESTQKKKHKKVRWTSVEKTTIYEKFGHHFILKSKPTRKEIKQVWEGEKNLKNRSLQQVVTYINNIVTKKQNISTPIRQKIENMVSNGKDKLSP